MTLDSIDVLKEAKSIELKLIEVWRNVLEDHYVDDIRDIAEKWPEKKTITISLTKLIEYGDIVHDLDLDILTLIEKYGIEFLEAFYATAFNLIRQHGVIYSDPYVSLILTDFEDLFIKTTPKDIRSSSVGRLIMVEGVVRRISEIKRSIRIGLWRCPYDHMKTQLIDPFDKIEKKVDCEECRLDEYKKEKVKMIFDERNSVYVNSQFIEIQDPSDLLSGREIPQRLTIYVEEDLVGTLYPGDRIKVLGILKPIVKGKKTAEALVDVYLHALGVVHVEKEFSEIEITPEDEKKIKDLSKDKDLTLRIIRSIAPSIGGIQGYSEIKEAIALALFGGVSKRLPDGTYRRGDIHILLVGDPGTGKSQLLKFVSELAPKAVYVVGKGATAAGLTAAVVRDELTGRWTVEAGALPLADGGVALIDEIEKMDSKDRTAMHSAMEQQEITISKAGIHATFKTRCAIIAAANPKFGKFLLDEEYKTSIIEQIDLPPSLLSRFDLIFAIKDVSTDKGDSSVASLILESHRSPETVKPDIDIELLRKYIAYARKYVHPRLTEEAEELIKDFYVNLRKKGREHKVLTITARQIEALIRLAEASARMRLSDKVTKEDAIRAIRIFEAAMRSALPEEGGLYDYLPVAGGERSSNVSKIAQAKYMIIEKFRASPEGVTRRELEELFKEIEEKLKINREKIEKIFWEMNNRGEIVEAEQGKFKLFPR
ncbi:MAG: hypothetical protein DRN30_06275 [Thermoplasmata archaeon]|nr:MAG: hypothetical protein DRN30_06275 [Thermoplasmata archaeon]